MSNACESIEPASHTPETWKEVLLGEREKPYFVQLMNWVESERKLGKRIYPAKEEVFNALTLTPFERVQVVIVGQDPYHGPNQAHGLSFSVKPGVPAPPSLQNIYKELRNDLKIEIPNHGSLENWARQGVLLLNAVLTVEEGQPQSHANRGWETFTDRVIKELNDRKEGIIFLLWGSYAQKKGAVIDRTRQHVLEAPHPSPLSASRGFLGCQHFSATNKILALTGRPTINWA